MSRRLSVIMALIVVLANALAAPVSTGARSEMSASCADFPGRYGSPGSICRLAVSFGPGKQWGSRWSL